MRCRIVAGIDERKIINRFLIILASSERPVMGVHHLESQDLKGQGNQLAQLHHMSILVVKDDENVLGEIFRTIHRYS